MDKEFIRLAIEKARESVVQGGFPAGAVVVKSGKVIGSGISLGSQLSDPTSHGEMAAIRSACAGLKSSDLSGAILYASMQPCVMCFGASMWSSIGKIVFACSRDKVAAEYYGGSYHIPAINADLLRPIELVHFSELENEALAVVRAWEKRLG